MNDTCTACHTNISQAHPNAQITCIECHGGNALEAADVASLNGVTFGDGQFMSVMNKAHVRPKQGLDDQFLQVLGQKGACFRAADDPDCNTALGEDPKDGVGTVDDAVDAEYNLDLNYVRFINPGDLRVAQASCGGAAPGAGNYGGCHTEEVGRVRRSIMATQAGVVSAAYLGNVGSSQERMGGPQPRGYTLNLDAPNGADACIKNNQFDENCLAAQRMFPSNDHVSALDPFNQNLDVVAATLMPLPGDQSKTLPHQGYATRLDGFGGQSLFNSIAWDRLDPVSGLTNPDLGLPPPPNCAPGLVTINPLDAVLRGFRAYYPLWIPGTGKNFAFVAGNTIKHADDPTKAFNPFGRGHASGCTGCHMLYEFDGKSQEAQAGGDPMIQAAGRFPTLDLVEGGTAQQQGMSVAQAGKQQRFYPKLHQLTSRIPTRQCGYCHTFVTRVDLAYQGMFEVEEGDVLARQVPGRPNAGDITWTTGDGTKVRIFDALERVEPAGGANFHISTDPRVAQYNAALKAECARRGINCDDAGIYTFDFNNNGKLDAGEDLLGTGELLLPDRIPRSAQTDGRQMRILYGGATGAQQMKDIHLEKGMHCIDCHFYQDDHGDGLIHDTNWETIEIECEDCHGYSTQRAWEVNPGKLLTSGPNGGNDLFKARDPFRTAQFPKGRPFFELRNDGPGGAPQLWQRSRVTPGLEWPVAQVATNDPSFVSHAPQHIASGPRDAGAGKLECYSCHNAFAANCLTCHYQENYSKQQLEVWLADSLQPQKTDFQLFGMIRGPLILGVDGDAESHKLSPFRSTMEAFVSVADCNGNTFLGDVIHSNCRSGKPVSGVAMNNFMPHSVRTDVVKDCATCHPAQNSAGHVVNNHIVAQTLGLGTGRLNDVGDWLFVATNQLDIVDIKDESELGDTKAKNSFPGFIVGNTNDMTKGALLRSFAVSPSGATMTPADVAIIRGFNGNLCNMEQLVNPDIAVIAGGAQGLFVMRVDTPDTMTGGAKPFAVGAGNVVGVDVVGQDISDPIVYAADATAGFVTYDLSGLNALALATPTGLAARHTTTNWPAGTPARGVKVMGTRAAVATDAGLVLVDVSNTAAPSVIGSTVPLCFADEQMSCGRKGRRVTVENVIAYVATDDGLVAVDVSQSPPAVVGGLRGMPVEDVALSGHLAFLAAGASGLVIVDVTDPADMRVLSGQSLVDAKTGGTVTAINQAHGVVVGTVPTQTWVFVADGSNGVRAVNVSTLFDPYRPLQGTSPLHDATHDALTLERRDPFSPRDTTAAIDQLPTVTFPTTGPAKAIARGLMLDRMVDESGRRLRDAWNPGSAALSADQMNRMRAVTGVTFP